MRSVCACLAILLCLPLLAATRAQQPVPYRILVTNDDGIRAPGLAALVEALQTLGEVIVVAPSENQSGKSHSVNTIEPVFREDLTLPSGVRAIGLSSTPATTVAIALKNIVRPRPDLLVSGINNAYNLGFSGYLGGTVGAARQGAMEGVPAIAASMATAGVPRDLGPAAVAVLAVATQVKAHGLPPFSFLNVNIPPRPADGYRGTRVTAQGMVRGGRETFAEMRHPSGRTMYFSVYQEGDVAAEGTDAWAVSNGYVSVTPMHVTEFDPVLADRLRGWFP